MMRIRKNKKKMERNTMADILIVEDDMSIREILHMHLSLVGHQVRGARTQP